VAGGNGPGERLDQLNRPLSIILDSNENLYVSDSENHRVLKFLAESCFIEEFASSKDKCNQKSCIDNAQAEGGLSKNLQC